MQGKLGPVAPIPSSGGVAVGKGGSSTIGGTAASADNGGGSGGGGGGGGCGIGGGGIVVTSPSTPAVRSSACIADASAEVCIIMPSTACLPLGTLGLPNLRAGVLLPTTCYLDDVRGTGPTEDEDEDVTLHALRRAGEKRHEIARKAPREKDRTCVHSCRMRGDEEEES